MSELRKKFSENAEQFDALMVEMLNENELLRHYINEILLLNAYNTDAIITLQDEIKKNK